jgi:hypothetical protein
VVETTAEKAPTVMRLAQTWLLVRETPLLRKEFGQLRCLRDKCGPDTLHVIEWVLHDWPEFTERVKQYTGFDSVPATPHIGFLLKFYVIAVAMMADTCPERVAHTLGKWAVDENGASTGL